MRRLLKYSATSKITDVYFFSIALTAASVMSIENHMKSVALFDAATSANENEGPVVRLTDKSVLVRSLARTSVKKSS